MESLLYNMPRFWKMEDKAVGADLGFGRFHFNFIEEADLVEVLNNGPYHFDSWMVSVVRWEPCVASDYPSDITFWIQVRDIPFHYWAADTISSVGRAIGVVREIDEESGSMRVTINGFKPLIFQTIIPFDNGEEIVVSLQYEKLANYCKYCYKLSHLMGDCLDLSVKPEIRSQGHGESHDAKRKQVEVLTEGKAWEIQRRNPAKRALFASGAEGYGDGEIGIDQSFRDKVVNSRQGVNGSGFMREGRLGGGEKQRYGLRDGAGLGAKTEQFKYYERAFRIKGGRGTHNGKDFKSNWPLPLHQFNKGTLSAEVDGLQKLKNPESDLGNQKQSDMESTRNHGEDETEKLLSDTDFMIGEGDDLDFLLEEGEMLAKTEDETQNVEIKEDGRNRSETETLAEDIDKGGEVAKAKRNIQKAPTDFGVKKGMVGPQKPPTKP